jgi:hypothetical protein
VKELLLVAIDFTNVIAAGVLGLLLGLLLGGRLEVTAIDRPWITGLVRARDGLAPAFNCWTTSPGPYALQEILEGLRVIRRMLRMAVTAGIMAAADRHSRFHR